MCANRGCKDGLVTEYWHMDWMMPGARIGPELVSEYRDRYDLYPVTY